MPVPFKERERERFIHLKGSVLESVLSAGLCLRGLQQPGLSQATDRVLGLSPVEDQIGDTVSRT